jgi:hypothetical protein
MNAKLISICSLPLRLIQFLVTSFFGPSKKRSMLGKVHLPSNHQVFSHDSERISHGQFQGLGTTIEDREKNVNSRSQNGVHVQSPVHWPGI